MCVCVCVGVSCFIERVLLFKVSGGGFQKMKKSGIAHCFLPPNAIRLFGRLWNGRTDERPTTESF